MQNIEKKDFLREKTGINNTISPKMIEALRSWKKAYMNESPWLNKDVDGLELPSTIASEIARLVTVESIVDITGSPKADYVSQSLEVFRKSKKSIVEYACAIGGMYFKPYLKGTKVMIDYVYQDEVIPFMFDGNGEVTGAVFPTFIFKDKCRYTRLEIHTFNENQYTIENKAFKSKEKFIDDLFVGNLGNEVALDEIEEWENLDEKLIINGVERPFFSYFKIPLANNIDRKSPIGISVYARAMNDIKKADVQYSRIDWEFESKETAIELDETYLSQDVYGNVKLPKGKERMFRTYSGDSISADKLFEHYSPEIRDQSFIQGLNKYLQQVEFKCGLAYGTISDPQQVDKTAEEIRSSKQRSYQLVHDIQGSLETSLKNLIISIDEMIEANGIFSTGDINVAFTWDDSIVIDADKEKQQDIQDINTGVLNKYEYRMKWYGEDEKTAKAKIAEMNSQRPGITSSFKDIGNE